MRIIFMLAAANIRKSKSQSISLLAFVLIAAMFLNIGLVLYFNYGAFFDKHAEELHSPHAVIIQDADFSTEEQFVWLEKYPQVIEAKKLPAIASFGDYYMNGAKANAAIAFSSISTEINELPLIGDSRPLENGSIYVPYLMKVAGGFELGDDYRLNLDNTELHFTIAGFTEDIMYGSLMINLYRFYVSEETYAALSSDFPNRHCWIHTVRMEDSVLGVQAELDYLKEFYYSQETADASSVFLYTVSYDVVRIARTTIPMIMALLVIAFALIILAVSLIVIRFGIINNIADSMINIGALKAVGYKNNQIISSMLLQFGGIAISGGIVGIAASQLLLPSLSKILESQSALIWNPGFDLILACVSLCSILLLVMLVSFIAVRRIYKLYPLVALRGGLETHNFRKNKVPLEKSHGALPFLLAMKQLAQSKKQAVMIAVIIAVVSFASITGICVYYNIGVKSDSFTAIIAGEKPDAILIVEDRTNTGDVAGRIRELPEVRKAFEYQQMTFLVNEVEASAFITEDFSLLEGGMLYEGRYPKHSNEIVIGGILSKVAGKGIGDTIEVTYGDQSKEFLITGLIQLANNGGINMGMSHDGLLTFQSDIQFNQVYVYLTDGADAKAFIESLKATEGDVFRSTIDMKELLDAQMGSYGSIFAAVAAGILLITVVVVVLILYLVIKTTILRQRRELGIQKALGFTTMQLMNQIALNYTPIILAGVVLGGIGGYLGFNPLFAMLTHGMGIIKVNMPAPADWTIFTCIILTALAYLVSIMVAWRIRKISAYSLINE